MATSYQDPFLQPNAQSTNPTVVPQSTKTYGSSNQFNVDPFMQPFPFTDQKTENQSFNQQFTGWLGSQETPEQTRERFENRYGYKDLAESYFRNQEAASGVMDAIRATPDNVANRSRETVVTQGQVDKIVNKEVADLMQTYSQLGEITEAQGKRLAFIEQNMNTAAQLELAQQQKMMTPWLQAYDDKNIMQARQYSGWTFANQLELNRLLANQQAGLSWTDAEATRANQLAMQEKQFEFQLKYLEKQNEFALDLWQ